MDPLDKLTFILVFLLHHLPETRNDDVLDLVDLVRIPLPQPFEHVVHVDEGATVLVENVMHGEVRVEYEELDQHSDVSLDLEIVFIQRLHLLVEPNFGGKPPEDRSHRRDVVVGREDLD